MVATQLEKLRADIEGTRLRQPSQSDNKQALVDLLNTVKERQSLRS